MMALWKMAAASLLAVAGTLSAAGAGEDRPVAKAAAIVWNVDNLEKIGGHKVAVLGAPEVIGTDKGKAVRFGGRGDALLVEANPLEGFETFTFEVVFRPDAGGLPEQRFFHCQEDGSENRVMFETRLPGGANWYLDTFVQSGRTNRPMADPQALHPLGEWVAAALVFDGRMLSHYVNGAKERSSKAAFAAMGPGRTSIGMRINKVHWFKGVVRQARFTPRALPPEEFLKP